jgi:serine/threonine protein phosphatase PrpC
MFTVLEAVSRPGSAERANEDACGSAGDFLWVLDGAQLPGWSPVFPLSDAAWFTATLNARLQALAPYASDGPALLAEAVGEVAGMFLAQAPDERREPLSWPITQVVLARVGAGACDLWSLGDSAAYLSDADGSVTVLDAVPELRDAETKEVADLFARTGATTASVRVTPLFRERWVERRRRQMSGEEPPVLSLDPGFAARATHLRVPFEPGANLLLATDGFSALVELYRAGDPAWLLDRARATGLAPLLDEIREIEAEDPDGRRFPRYKTSDDATAVLARLA